ncbi:LppP/LprE family lipoprotein [Streptomyces morookaense]|uniref:LppP/LprE family lipoprotein n=1 Tax=Streptomyces morookaense TaxID=1970 RepID=UPI0033D612C7
MHVPRIAARLAAIGACLILTVSCASSKDAAPNPTRSVGLWSPSAAGQSPKGASPGAPFNVDAALAQIKRMGFTADTEPAELKTLKGPFRAIHSHCTGTTDGHCVIVMFFHDNDYVGYDARGTGESTILSQDGTTVALSYPVFKPTDPMCCASGGTREFRARWEGGKVAFTPPMPGNPNLAGG